MAVMHHAGLPQLDDRQHAVLAVCARRADRAELTRRPAIAGRPCRADRTRLAGETAIASWPELAGKTDRARFAALAGRPLRARFAGSAWRAGLAIGAGPDRCEVRIDQRLQLGDFGVALGAQLGDGLRRLRHHQRVLARPHLLLLRDDLGQRQLQDLS